MGTRRLGFALVAALIISIAITSFFYVRVTRAAVFRRGGDKASDCGRSRRAARNVPLTAENLTEINWPANVPWRD